MTIVGGSTPSAKEPAYWGAEHCFATPKDLPLFQSRVLTATARHIAQDGVSRIRSMTLPKAAALLSSREPIGYLELTAVPPAINQGIIAMVCDGPVDALYPLHWARANTPAMENRAGGTTLR